MWDYDHHLSIVFTETDLADPRADTGARTGRREVCGVGIIFSDFGEGFADGDGAGGEVGGHAGGGVFGGVGACCCVVFDFVVYEVAESGHACFVAGGPEGADAGAGGGGIELFGLWDGGDGGGGVFDIYRFYVLGRRGKGVEE